MDSEISPLLSAMIPIAEGIAKTLGEQCEVVIHDLKNPDSSLFYIAGNITGRKLGSPLTNLSLQTLKQEGDDAHDLIGYETLTKDGKKLKSSTIYIRNDAKQVIGCLCINLQINHIETCIKILESLTKINSNSNVDTKENFYVDVNEAMEEIVSGVLKDYAVPLSLMEKDDKIRVVNILENRGVFLVKGSVDYIANILNVSRYTIYNYLNEIRSSN